LLAAPLPAAKSPAKLLTRDVDSTNVDKTAAAALFPKCGIHSKQKALPIRDAYRPAEPQSPSRTTNLA
jgi:hypothetical protein